MDLKLLASLLEALGKDALQSIVTYHGIKARGVDKQVGLLCSFYEKNAEALPRDLNRFDNNTLSGALRSPQAKEAAIRLTGKSDFTYDDAALTKLLATSSKEQLLGFIRAVFLKGRLPKELLELKRELTDEDKLRARAEIIIDALPVATLNALSDLRGLKTARAADTRKTRLREAYGVDLALLLKEINSVDKTLLPAMIYSPAMVKVAHQARGSINFSYRTDKLAPLLEEFTPEDTEQFVKQIFLEGQIPEEYEPFEFPLDENGRNHKEELEMFDAQIEQMEKIPDDTTAAPEKALSIKQPWAELILMGLKKLEVRQVPTDVRERVYLYAGLGVVDEHGQQRCQELSIDPEILPRGMIIGTVQIIGCLPARKGDIEKSGGDPETPIQGWYTWYLARPRRLKRDLLPKNNPQPGLFKPF
jgi:hypothetical protein